ncbi:MAG: histidine triad nucleotide-binding protein [Deltaproteobacteria bacterium]|nr:histidine triad nucleotide-binding protein [Deltaproteobacteria bacterium]
MEAHCLFCKIVAKTIPAKLAYEDERVLAFHDINPQSPVHVLVIPKAHMTSLAHSTPDDEALLGHCLRTVATLAESLGVAHAGYRTVINTGIDGGQTVHHLHVHLLAGRAHGWPPG